MTFLKDFLITDSLKLLFRVTVLISSCMSVITGLSLNFKDNFVKTGLDEKVALYLLFFLIKSPVFVLKVSQFENTSE